MAGVIGRLALVAVVAFTFNVLLTVHVTLPALTVVGLIAWAVLASVAVAVLWRRSRTE